MLNKDQLLSILRAIVPAGTAFLVGKGWIPAGSAGEVGAAVVTLLAACWGAFTHTDAQKITAVAGLPNVVGIVVDPVAPASDAAALAAHDTSQPKVIAGSLPGVLRTYTDSH